MITTEKHGVDDDAENIIITTATSTMRYRRSQCIPGSSKPQTVALSCSRGCFKYSSLVEQLELKNFELSFWTQILENKKEQWK